MTYVAVGIFASSVTRNQLIAFILTFVLLLILGMMLPFIVDITMAGSGLGRESAIRSLSAAGLKVRAIEDVTPLPHNGCRPKKRRRV